MLDIIALFEQFGVLASEIEGAQGQPPTDFVSAPFELNAAVSPIYDLKIGS